MNAGRIPVFLALALLVAGCAEPPPASQRSLRSILGTNPDSDPGFAKAARPIDFAFPRDHGPHPGFRSEWWYLTAVLADDAGNDFGVQFTVFRQGAEPRGEEAVLPRGTEAWRTGQVYMGHLAISDVGRARHVEAERLARGHPALAGVTAKPFRAHIEGWELASVGEDFWPLRLQAATREFAVDLVLSGTRPIVAQGERGLSRKGPDNASYYYSAQRIGARGKLVVGATTRAVTGDAWLDREWSTSVLAPEYAGWDWFALHLDDGRDLMLSRLRRVDGRTDHYNAGSLADGRAPARMLTADDFVLVPLEYWRGWPVAWRLDMRSPTEQFVIRAAFEDQVMDTSVRYWEGVVYVEDGRGRRMGSGYMELTGY